MATILLTSVMNDGAPMPPTQLNNMGLMYDKVHLRSLPAGAFWYFCQSKRQRICVTVVEHRCLRLESTSAFFEDVAFNLPHHQENLET